MKLANFLGILFLFEACLLSNAIDKTNNNPSLPVVVITWDYATVATKGKYYFDMNLPREMNNGFVQNNNLKTFLIIFYKHGT